MNRVKNDIYCPYYVPYMGFRALGWVVWAGNGCMDGRLTDMTGMPAIFAAVPTENR